MERIENHLKPGVKILDTHLGSGSIAIASLVEREKIKARIDEVGLNMTIDSERLNNKRLTELRKELENLDKQV